MEISLQQVLKECGSVLIIDSASARVWTGLLRVGVPTIWRSCEEEAATGIFRCAEEVLKEAGMKVRDVGGFVFCEGPGSVLGIRTAAVAIRTWRVLKGEVPVFSFRSLEVVARFLKEAGVKVISDARRERWHVADASGKLERVAREELPSEGLVMPEGFRVWGEVPVGVRTVGYDLPKMMETLVELPLLRECAEPEAFLHEEPSYVKWVPEIHRAPVKEGR